MGILDRFRKSELERATERREKAEARLRATESRVEEARWKKESWPKVNVTKSFQTRVVSTEKVICREKESEVHNAIQLIHEDGTIEVKCRCRGECDDCKYEYY